MSSLPITSTVAIEIPVMSNSQDFWVTNNPVIPDKIGAHALDKQTIRIGDGKTHYNDLESVIYIGATGQISFDFATTESPGIVDKLATEEDIKNSTGTGVLQSKHIDRIVNMVTTKTTEDYQPIGVAIGDRELKPWDIPLPGWMVANGQSVTSDTREHRVLSRYLNIHSNEVITLEAWNNLSIAAGGVGGVHFYAILENGDIRLPDMRGDYKEAAGFDNRQVLEWRTDTMRPITGSVGRIAMFEFAQDGAFYSSHAGYFNEGNINTGYANTLNLDSSRLGSNFSGIVTKPRAAGYLPVIYVGVGQDFFSEEGLIFLANTRSKNIAEAFESLAMTAPGAIIADGSLIQRNAFEALTNRLIEDNVLIPEETWLNYLSTGSFGGKVPFFSSGPTENTLRLPLLTIPGDGGLNTFIQVAHSIADTGEISYDTLINELLRNVSFSVILKQIINAQVEEIVTDKLSKMTFYQVADSAPTDNTKLWIRSSDRNVFYHDGTSWIPCVGVYKETTTI